jgi:hypothetical protein
MITERKPASYSRLHSLNPAQRKLLDDWLFERNLSYQEICRRGKEKFGFSLNRHSLVNYYHKTQQKRNLDEIIQSANHAKSVVKKLAKNPAETAKAIMNIAGQLAFNTAVVNAAGQKPDVDNLSKVMDVYLSTRKDDREAGKFELEREQWEFDVARLCFQHHQELQKIAANQSLDEDARLLAIRQRLFGMNLPK